MSERRPRLGRILVVEDEAYVRESLGEMLRSRSYHVTLVASVDAAIVSLSRAPVDVVLTDLKMPGASGLELLRQIQAGSPEIPVVILTGHGSVPSAVECIQSGASDYILKPADPGALEVALERAMASRALRREVGYLRAEREGPEPRDLPVGESPAWSGVMNMVRAAAPTDSTVLLLGESGTGKELLARLIHRWSDRARGPYVSVNCAAVPVEIWESEFFGHRRGSFTGAASDREGRFRLADRGTLFMDEIGAMPLPAQAKLLRVLQDGEFDRIGDDQPTLVDVRIVAATNSDLEAGVRTGRFREDLYYRLNVVRIEVPPLRDRPGDVRLLALRFSREIAARLGRPVPEISLQVLEDMAIYPWPGNVRELRNVIERSLILGGEAGLDSLDLSLLRGMSPAPAGRDTASPMSLRGALVRREREAVLDALRASKGVRKEAARLLGIDQRNLAYYLHKHGIDPDHLPG